MLNLSFDEKYAAIGNQESYYEGVFVVAVKTTGIFCRPSCRARKPKAQNVIFYVNAQEALYFGFRACKICRPMELEGAAPEFLQKLLDELENNPGSRITDSHLQQRGLEPSYVRRWFNRHQHITFQGYQRLLRLNAAYCQIQNGVSITSAAFDCGYESLSGFHDCYRSTFGSSPKDRMGKGVINIVRFGTRLGAMVACATQHGVCVLAFADKKALEAELQSLANRLNAVILPGRNTHLVQLQAEVYSYLRGDLEHFGVCLHLQGSVFQQSVWELLQCVPYGETCSTDEQAQRLGELAVGRNIASANRRNPVALVVPCHRLVAGEKPRVNTRDNLPRQKFLRALEKHSRGFGFYEVDAVKRAARSSMRSAPKYTSSLNIKVGTPNTPRS